MARAAAVSPRRALAWLRRLRTAHPLARSLSSEGAPADRDALVFPKADGRLWTGEDWRNWRRRAWARALAAVGLERSRPCDLRHSVASLLLHEGRSVIYVARQLGHDAQTTLSTYGHVIDELDDARRVAAEDAIMAACQARVSSVSHKEAPGA